MEIRKTRVYCDKYDTEGEITEVGGLVTKLNFFYGGKDIEFAVTNYLPDESYEEYGARMIEIYIEKLSAKDQKTYLFYWYVDEIGIAYGNVRGHYRLNDSVRIHTSLIKNMSINGDELIINTKNTTYHCPLKYCKFDKQDQYPDMIPDYDRIKAEYEGEIENPSIEAGKVLLVLSDFDEYYFHSLYCVPEEGTEALEYSAYPHVGMTQDSFLIMNEKYRDKGRGAIDIRYFPYYKNIEFYSECTDGMPLFIENIGETNIYCRCSCGLICIPPQQRKKICSENAEKEKLDLPKGDLYPIQFWGEDEVVYTKTDED